MVGKNKTTKNKKNNNNILSDLVKPRSSELEITLEEGIINMTQFFVYLFDMPSYFLTQIHEDLCYYGEDSVGFSWPHLIRKVPR